MSRSNLPVVAAIPNYNMSTGLGELLPQLAKQDYAGIFVLDDASTDESCEVTLDFDNTIHFVAGAENVGAGANRNRIMGALGREAIIHFIDADMDLGTEGVPDLAHELLAADTVGFVGGLVTKASGAQLPFNYGPRQCLRTDVAANLQTRVSNIGDTDPERAKRLRAKHHKLLQGWPDPLLEPAARRVFWSSEANLLIRSDVFSGMGGFDPKLREHEVQDLAIRMSAAGLERRFDPALAASHKEIIVRPGNRTLQMMKAEVQIARKHGVRNWLMPGGKFTPVID